MRLDAPLLAAVAVAAAVATTRAGAGTPASANAAPARPSVLLVTLDTTRADRLGCYGSTRGATPRIDAIAKEGTVFLRAVSPAPLTLVSHASLMTGLEPRRHGVRDNESFRLGPGPATLAARLGAAGWTTSAFVSSLVLDRGTGIGRGFARFDDTVRIGERSAFNYEERAASQTNAAVESALDALKPPFFLWVHYYDPHMPYVPPLPVAKRFPGNPYDGEIAFMDEAVGRLVDELSRRGLMEGAVTIVAGDHGESLGERGEPAHDVFLYEATQRVPLIVRGPGVAKGTVPSRVGLIDVMPTVLDLAGLKPEPGLDGRSLVPLLRSPASSKGPEREFRIETWFPAFHYGWPPVRGLVAGDWKLIDVARPELYDLRSDPGEKTNLASARPEIVARLRSRLGPPDLAAEAGGAEDAASAERRRTLASLGYVSGGGPAAARRGVDAIDPKDGIELVGLIERARVALAAGRPEEAQGPLEEVLRRNPRNLPARTMLASALLSRGRFDEAIEAYRRAATEAPEAGFTQYGLASALAERARQVRSASRTPAGAAARGPSGAPAPAPAGSGAPAGTATPGGSAAAPPPSAESLTAEARSAYGRVLALDPRDAEAALGLARLELDAGRHDAARAALVAAREAGVEDPEIELLYGILEAGRGATAAAETAFDHSLVLNPASPEAHVAAGRLAWSRGRAQAAADHYAEALRLRPDAAVARTLGSIRLDGLGDRAGAVAAFRRSLELEPAGRDADAARELVRELEGP